MSSARPVPDAAARDRIVRELDRNLLVEAGAGSGKTQKLAERMAAGIADGVYQLDRLAAVTFTRKAAAELRGRFQISLEAQLKDADGDRQRRILDALANIERFFAGTIHSFCARLLRERPVEAGVAPGFTELDDVEDRLIREQSWRDYRAQASDVGDADLLELLDAGVTPKHLDKAFETVCLYEDVTFPPGNAAKPDVAKAWDALALFWREIESRLPASIDPQSKCATIKRAQAFRREWRAYVRGHREPAVLAKMLGAWKSQAGVTQKWWSNKGVAKEAEQLHETFRDATVLPFLTAWRRYLYARCIRLLMRARESAQAERRRRSALSFSDLLILTARVLREHVDVRRALQHKYRWLFVDEFQDTDPVQAEIMFLLASDATATGGGGSDWRTVPLRPGALFVVGDPKQSIYRFRRADIDIYNEVRTRLAGSDGKGLVRLTTNFRSVPGLCQWANDVFKERFPAAPTTHAPAFAPLDAYRLASADGADLAVLDIPASVEASDVGEVEAGSIARYIRAEVDAKRKTCGDFLILTRRKKGLRPIANALEALRVPIEVTGAGAFNESEEVRDIALLLAALSDPQDAVALVGVLRGALFGLSDRDLFAYRQGGGYLSFFSEVETTDPAAGRVAGALEVLRRWFKWVRMLTPGAALERVLEESGYLALAATSRGGVEAGDLLHAVDRVRAVVEKGFTLAEAADALASWSGLERGGPKESTDVDSLPLEPGRRDVVRLMNLHKAKGLEAAVVFLADPLGGFKPRPDIHVVREGAEARGYFEIIDEREDSWFKNQIAEPEGWDAFEAAELAYLTAEEDRLLYVAATRAKDLLVVGRYAGGRGSRTLAWAALSSKMTSAPTLTIPAAVASPPAVEVDLSPSVAAAAVSEIAAAHERAGRPSWAATSVTAESKRLPRFAMESTDALDLTDPTRAVVHETASHRADAGQAWGTLVHGLLEHAMRHRTASRDDLRRLAMWLTMEEPQLRKVIDQAIDSALAVVASDELKTARASVECHEEVPFAVRRDEGATPTVVTGVIDLAYRAGDAWDVVDYKTDADAKDVDLQTRHQAQLGAYEEAWSRVSGTKTRARILSTR